MNIQNIARVAAICALLSVLAGPSYALGRHKDFGYAVSLYDEGMYERAREIFSDIALRRGDSRAEGWSVLCALRLGTPGCNQMMDNYMDRYPYAMVNSQLRFYRALNYFDAGNWASASGQFERIKPGDLQRQQRAEYFFKRAYCDYAALRYDTALTRFSEVISRRDAQSYKAPSHYYSGYILYSRGDFTKAQSHLEQASSDSRFKEISDYYILECRFMLKDYRYVASNGPAMMDSVSEQRRSRLSRLVSESYLVLGDARSARDYYTSPDTSDDKPKSDEDWFYEGSVLYAVGDWEGAARNFSRMRSKTDSLGQIANYHCASCYLHLKNKVAALECLKYASESDVDPVITEDAMYNYAKLAFDLNGDISVFERYLSIYSDKKRGEEVYGYIAVGELQRRNYAAAVEAYDKIDELDDGMKSNYMKANYLRAKELIDGGSWRASVPCLKAAAYYSDRREGFNQLSRYWLAEAFFRDNKFDDSRSLYGELYNTSALYGTTESSLLPYNIAYCYFQQGDYENATKWFGEYLDSGAQLERKESFVRRGDCYFQTKNYRNALESYDAAISEFPDVNDIYPYYQSALASGLAGNNAAKIRTLSLVSDSDPTAAYYPEAICELGVTYSRTGNDAKAKECFNKLIDNTRDSTYISRALVELGTLSLKSSDFRSALAYYRRVVEEMPLSNYTDDALTAMESVYRSQNDPQGYFDYLDGIGKSSVKSEDEREEMIYNAAEQIFLAGNYSKALASFNSYLEAYPEGNMRSESEFYIAESYRNLDQREDARDHYAVAMADEGCSFLELSVLRYSDLSYTLQHYPDAYAGYRRLQDIARIAVNRHAARVGMMRSAYSGRMYGDAVSASDAVYKDGGSSAAERTESSYIKGKSLMGMSRRDEAMSVFTALAKDPSTPYGGEAAYILITDSYDRGEFGDVETKVFAFSESSNPDQYWLAKSFVVLGDSYAEQGEWAQAKATFESVRDGYNSDRQDDVKDNLDLRISKAAEMIRSNNN